MANNFKVLFIYPNTMMATLLPLHLPLLSACLKEKGFEVKLFDTTCYKTEEKSFEEKKVELLMLKKFDLKDMGIKFKKTNIYKDLQELVENFKPDLIGISLLEDTYELGLNLLNAIKDYKIPVIAGGVFTNFNADKIIQEKTINIICIGEGEHAIVELCEAMRGKKDFSNIKNLWIKKEDKTIMKNLLRPLANLDDLPFLDFDIFETNRFGRPMHGRMFRMLHIEFQRGCPFSCTYCEAPSIRKMYKDIGFNNYFRQKSIERFIAELKYLKEKYKPDYIYFSAESFLTVKIKELRKLAKIYKSEIALPFWCQSRPELITNENIALLKDMGVADMQFGIEHGNEEFRAKILNRHCTNRKILEGLRIIEKYKIPYTVNNIIGFPEETRDLIFDTIELNKLINPKNMNCNLFTPYTGTYLRQYCIEKAYLKEDAKTQQCLDGADYNYKNITKKELKGLQRTFSLYVRLPDTEYKRIERAEKFDDKGNKIFKELSKLYCEKYF